MQDQMYNPELQEMEALRSKMVDESELKKLGENLPTEKGAFRVIGNIPKKGETINVNGLIYDVVASDNLKGRFVAKLAKT